MVDPQNSDGASPVPAEMTDRVHCCDALDGLRQLPDDSIHCCVTSPPYWGLRDYGVAGQFGLEKTPEEYVARLIEIFRELRRILRNDGTLWLNLGDSYCASPKGNAVGDYSTSSLTNPDRQDIIARTSRRDFPGLKPKDLVGIPWRVAFALQADGWWLRQDIIWHKPNPMPESVTDRCTKSHEYIFLLTKSARYFCDMEAIKEPYTKPLDRYGGADKKTTDSMKENSPYESAHRERKMRPDPSGRNPRSVWSIATEPYSEAHFAVFPTAIPRLCILAGTSAKGCCPICGAPWERVVEKERTFESGSGKAGHLPDGKNGKFLQGGGETLDIRRGPCVYSRTVGWQPTCCCGAEPIPCQVLDPFAGSGTTVAVAKSLGRSGLGFELNSKYIALAERRIAAAVYNHELDL